MSAFLTNFILNGWLEDREQTIDLSWDATAVRAVYNVTVLSKHPDSMQFKKKNLSELTGEAKSN